MTSYWRTDKTRIWIAVAAVAALLLSGGVAEAGTEGRISGLVVDEAEKPIEGVQVTVSAVGLDIHRKAKTNRKGKFTITVLNATRDFVIKLEKEGFQTVQESLDPIVGGTVKPVYTMLAGQAMAPEQMAELQRKDKAAKVYNQGVQLFAKGDFAAAAEFFQQSLEEDANLGLAHLALARIYLAREKDAAAALPHAEKANELVPDEDLSQIVLFDSLWDLEQYDRALEVLEQMAASGKVADKVAVRAFNAGARAARSGDWTTAKARYEQALSLDPNLSPAHLILGQIELNSGNYEVAREHTVAYLEVEPEDARGLRLLYHLQMREGDEAAAMATFDRMAAVDPAQVVEAFFEEGVEHFNAGRNELALSAFEKVLRANPDYAQAHYFFGLANASGGDIAAAKTHLSRFLELAPDDPEAAVAREMLAGLE